MITRTSLIIFIQLLLISTVYSQIATVDVNKCLKTTHRIDLADITSKLTYIRLSDANQTALIGNISRIAANESFIVIYDNLSNKLFLFDSSGNFVRLLLSTGKGPYEYIGVNSIDINQTNDVLVLINSAEIVIVNALTDSKFQFSIGGSAPVARWLDERIVLLRPHPYYISNKGYEISFLDKHGKTIRNLKQNSITGINYNDMSPYYSCGKNGGDLYYWNAYDDTVYTITNEMKVMPRLVFKHSSQKYSNDERKKGVRYDIYSGKYVQENYRESGNMSFSSIAYGQKGASVYINRITGEGYDVLYDYSDDHFQGFRNNLDGGVEFWPICVTVNGDLLTYIDPNHLRESFLRGKKAKIPVKYPAQQDSLQKNVIEKITLMDNPIIIKMKK
jgi:hypothetical protein